MSGERRTERPLTARLLRAAGRISREELFARAQVGPRVIAEIDVWLAAHGKRFRPDPLPVSEALAQAIGYIEAILDETHEHALLSAFVALPELHRSLAATEMHSKRGAPN